MKSKSILSIVAMALSLPLAQAGVTMNATVSINELAMETRAQSALKDVEALSADVAKESKYLKTAADEGLSMDANLDSLNLIRGKVNAMGKQIAFLQGNREALTPAGQHAFDILVPLAQSIAANTENAIAYFNKNGGRKSAGIYSTFAGNIFQNSEKIKQTLEASLKEERSQAE